MADEGLGIAVDKPMENGIYKRITKILSDSAGIKLKPVEFLKDKVSCDFFGYPLVGGKKAAKSKAVDNYLKIVVNIDRTGMQSTNDNSTTVGGVTVWKQKIKVKIKVKMSITIFDKDGAEVLDENFISKSKNEIEFESTQFSSGGFTAKKYKQNDDTTFQGLIDICSVNLVRKIK